MQYGWRFFRDFQPWSGSFRLFIGHMDHDGKRGIVRPLLLEAIEAGVAHDTPTMCSEDLDVNGFLQAALDCAWEIGLRPKQFADHTNELAAVRYHLEDMRMLAKVKS